MVNQVSDQEIEDIVHAAIPLLIGTAALTPNQLEVYERLIEEDRRRQSTIENFLRTPSAPCDLATLKTGIDHAYENSKALQSDAEVLAENGRAARCYALAHCAVEEVGKMAVLHSMCEIPRENQRLWAHAWKNSYRNHRVKYALGNANLWTDKLLEHLGAQFMYEGVEAELRERFRQLGLYVEYMPTEERWGSPLKVTTAMATDELGRASRAIRRATYYVRCNLFTEECLALRRDICGSIYPANELPPDAGEPWAKWVVDLGAVRREFFKELIRQEVLLPEYRDDQTAV